MARHHAAGARRAAEAERQADIERRQAAIDRRRQARFPPRGRRGQILAATLTLFNEAGYTTTTMPDIAAEAKASIGSIYHHFGGKEDLAAALYVEGLAHYHGALMADVLRERESAEEAVKELVRHHLRWVERNQGLARFLFAMREPDVVGRAQTDLKAMNARVFHAVQEWITEWVDAGELRELPIGVFYAIVFGPSQEFARQWLVGRLEESIDDVEGDLSEAAWRGVRA